MCRYKMIAPWGHNSDQQPGSFRNVNVYQQQTVEQMAYRCDKTKIQNLTLSCMNLNENKSASFISSVCTRREHCTRATFLVVLSYSHYCNKRTLINISEGYKHWRDASCCCKKHGCKPVYQVLNWEFCWHHKKGGLWGFKLLQVQTFSLHNGNESES